VEKKKFKAKMTYADRQKIPFVVLLGEDEIREGLVSVKDMQTGEQQKLTAEEAALMIKSTIDVKNNAPIICENCE
jgi:histidyl-tRNA synthetase